MAVSLSNLHTARVRMLKEMDTYARENFSEENFYNIWLADGVPDGADDDMYLFLATVDNCWMNCINAFRQCCINEGIITE